MNNRGGFKGYEIFLLFEQLWQTFNRKYFISAFVSHYHNNISLGKIIDILVVKHLINMAINNKNYQ